MEHYLGNLPAEVTSFVDRRREISEARRLLSASRLLTLTGAGGVGKTRLALRVAAGVRRAFAHGVWLVELAGLRDRTLVAHTVVQALEIHDDTGREPLGLLVDFLRDRQVLLVVDNCEHLVGECAVLADLVLRGAAGLRILATSRETLRVSGEQVLPVDPLSVGPPNASRPARTGPGDAGDGAVVLFAERAVAVVPAFAVTAENQEQVAGICRRLDGLPLAIELAAARLRVFSAHQILARLDDRFGLLTTGPRTVSARHRTLRAVIDWSFQLCSPDEQAVWARASVFAGSFGLPAAEEVCAGEDLPADSIVELLAGLVDKSILIRDNHSTQTRYRFLETLQQYGQNELRQAGQQDRLRRRHADWYLHLAEQGEREWFGRDQAAWLRRLRLEHANLRLALEFHLTRPGQTQAGLRLAAALSFYWGHSAALTEGRQWLDRALALHAEPSRHRAKALCAIGFIASHQGHLQAAVRWLEEAQELARQVGDASILAWATERLGTSAMFSGDLDRAAPLLEQALARYQALGEPDNLGAVLARLALAGTRVLRGDLAGTVELSQEARIICRAHGDRTYLAYALTLLGRAQWAGGNLAEAARSAQEALRLRRSVPDPVALMLSVELVAWIAETAGEHERAAVLLGAAHYITRTFGISGLLHSAAFAVPHRECQARTRQALGTPAFEAAFQRGTELDLDQVIAYTLGESSQPVPVAAAAADEPLAPLTRREQQVAELVAQGLSNKDIAARLVIAQRTAEGHVERILTKLGFTTRTRLAAWVSRQREGRDR
ncbi:putative ATPase/DNA-binding NarL/FixJ family response regulator [Kibdelosporangium banguiense]|uniref:ATPase/DNA-binding NarL/FixJ family response regulator n=1 Tax=Kibdelosporangium banguiense TaxID=1365924 RepID=A0ABS4TT40_9PSEU|nr:LuxR C-terminal-related transcriptional regulator [Kibdelosporangium banguiense]MBP2327576.1 putative ATPase/DNA-binding NarL/FixJ family response regulator [Kibdelosporangium banguiense]